MVRSEVKLKYKYEIELIWNGMEVPVKVEQINDYLYILMQSIYH